MSFSSEDAEYYLQEFNSVEEAYSKLRDVIENVLPRLQEIARQIHYCWLEAENADDVEFYGNLEEEISDIIKRLKEALEETK